MGVILDNPLRQQREALSEGQWFRSAFRQHCGCLLNLNKVGLHSSYAVCMHLQEFRTVHSMPPFDWHPDYTFCPRTPHKQEGSGLGHRPAAESRRPSARWRVAAKDDLPALSFVMKKGFSHLFAR
ncbi:MAG: hypothetical protein ABSF64_04170 [Bryobacteraceae bacterium]